MTVTPIARAMDRTRVRDAARRARTRVSGFMEAVIRVAHEPVTIKKSGQLVIHRAPNADPDDALLLVYDDRLDCYRPVRLPPGTRWELVEKAAGPKIWLPPGVRR